MKHLSGKHIKGYYCIGFFDAMIFGKAVLWRPACGPHPSHFVGGTLLRLDITDKQRSVFQDMIEVGIIGIKSIILVTYTDVCNIPGHEESFAAKLVEVNSWDVKA